MEYGLSLKMVPRFIRVVGILFCCVWLVHKGLVEVGKDDGSLVPLLMCLGMSVCLFLIGVMQAIGDDDHDVAKSSSQ